MGPGQVELVVRGPGALATCVRLFDWSRADEYETVFAVEAVADGVRARLENVTVTVWDDMREFFDGLARDFRGWEGERVWINNHLVLTATFGSGLPVLHTRRLSLSGVAVAAQVQHGQIQFLWVPGDTSHHPGGAPIRCCHQRLRLRLSAEQHVPRRQR
ncbi:DUF6228 family protein [Streptomyces pharetrae]|uniref:DUF6228 family protein n=1 Tax=Streptomyces pharetrae TaxID=291370 RepID=UPI0034602B69